MEQLFYTFYIFVIYRETLGSALLTKYRSGDQTKKNEMDRACGTYGGQERCMHGFGCRREARMLIGRSRRRWEGNIKMDLQKARRVSWDWFYLVQDRDRWWAFVNVIMNLRAP